MGFTLIELSIILVIIGLIVGGVLVGQDLIQVARARATLSQLQEYQTAVAAFKLKYNGLPGDLKNATTFGWTQPNQSGTWCIAGNGRIESSNGAANVGHLVPGYETTHFWRQLYRAGLIKETISNPLTTVLATSASAKFGDTLNNYLPSVSGNKRAYWNVSSQVTGRANYFNVFGFESVRYTFGSGNTPNDTFTPFTPDFVRYIDEKIDDGAPQLGRVRGVKKSSYNIRAMTTNGDGCSVNSTTYNNTDDTTCGFYVIW